MDPLTLPQIAAWAPDGDFEPRSFLRAHGTIAEAVALTAVFWPTFVEYRGRAFLEMAFDQAVVDDWFTQLGDGAAVESVVNQVHVWDLFGVNGEAEEEAAVFLASTIAETWRAAAAKQFPGTSFTVSVSNEPEDYGPTVTLTSMTR
jgi:hypothetical protein